MYLLEETIVGSNFLIKHGKIHLKLKEFQSLENDVCHTVVFGNVATVVASSKTLHWMQMANGSLLFT